MQKKQSMSQNVYLQFVEKLVPSKFLLVIQTFFAEHLNDHLAKNSQYTIAHGVRLKMKGSQTIIMTSTQNQV